MTVAAVQEMSGCGLMPVEREFEHKGGLASDSRNMGANKGMNRAIVKGEILCVTVVVGHSANPVWV